MYGEFNGVKTLGYQIPWELSAYILRNPSRRVIFMKRLNILQTVVSGLISQQTGIWHSWDVGGEVLDATPLRPLSIDFLRSGVADVAEEVAYFEDVIRSRTGPTHVLTYEELYLGAREDRRRVLGEAFRFLGVSSPPTDEIDELLDPARTKLNSSQTYMRLPNAREIDEALGNPETGSLFGPTIDGSSSKVQ
jgi:hypothetical protein